MEVGTGIGVDHLRWRRVGADLYGVDLTQTAVEVLDRKPEVTIVHGEVDVIDMHGDVMEKDSSQMEKLYRKGRKIEFGLLYILKCGPYLFIDNIISQSVYRSSGSL